MAARFVKEDPDGNSLDGKFGLAMSKDLWSAYGGLRGSSMVSCLSQDMDREDGSWSAARFSLNTGGTGCPAGDVQTWRNRSEFGVGPVKLSRILLTAGWALSSVSGESLPSAKFKPGQLSRRILDLSHSPSMIRLQRVSTGSCLPMIVVRKGYPHPEAVMKMINLWTENFLQDDTDQKLQDAYLGDLIILM